MLNTLKATSWEHNFNIIFTVTLIHTEACRKREMQMQYNRHFYRAHKHCKKAQFHESQYNFTFVSVLYQRYVSMSCNIIKTNTDIEYKELVHCKHSNCFWKKTRNLISTSETYKKIRNWDYKGSGFHFILKANRTEFRNRSKIFIPI